LRAAFALVLLLGCPPAPAPRTSVADVSPTLATLVNEGVETIAVETACVPIACSEASNEANVARAAFGRNVLRSTGSVLPDGWIALKGAAAECFAVLLVVDGVERAILAQRGARIVAQDGAIIGPRLIVNGRVGAYVASVEDSRESIRYAVLRVVFESWGPTSCRIASYRVTWPGGSTAASLDGVALANGATMERTVRADPGGAVFAAKEARVEVEARCD